MMLTQDCFEKKFAPSLYYVFSGKSFDLSYEDADDLIESKGEVFLYSATSDRKTSESIYDKHKEMNAKHKYLCVVLPIGCYFEKGFPLYSFNAFGSFQFGYSTDKEYEKALNCAIMLSGSDVKSHLYLLIEDTQLIYESDEQISWVAISSLICSTSNYREVFHYYEKYKKSHEHGSCLPALSIFLHSDNPYILKSDSFDGSLSDYPYFDRYKESHKLKETSRGSGLILLDIPINNVFEDGIQVGAFELMESYF